MFKEIPILRILDGFSGSGNWVRPWYKSVSFNIHIDSIDILNLPHITHCMDIQNFKPDREYHFVYLSPPCTHFVPIKKSNKVKTTPEQKEESIRLANLAFELASKAKLGYIIENPYSSEMKQLFPVNPFDKIPYQKVDYSEYGFPMKKSTVIWSNIKFNFKTKKEISYNRLPLHCMSTIEKSSVPLPLSEYIKRVFVKTFNKELQQFKLPGFELS